MFRQDFGLRFGVAYICVSMLNEIYCPFLDRSCLFIDFADGFPCSFSMIGNSHGAVTSGMDVSMLFIPGAIRIFPVGNYRLAVPPVSFYDAS